MKQVLVSGSLAYDHLYTFPGVFQQKILRKDSGPLSIAFNVTSKAVHFGGCAGNIVFNGKLMDCDFFLLGIAGKDFDEYDKWLKKNKIETSFVIRDLQEYTAQATVVTDQKGQQLTIFHPGAAAKSRIYTDKIKEIIANLTPSLAFAIISPNDRDFILSSIEGCSLNNIPFFFDPGQVMPLFTKNELREIMKKSCGLFLNEYEFNLLCEIMGMSQKEIIGVCGLVIVTLGENGSKIYHGTEEIFIPTEKVRNAKDPTGCGDAYRAGFLIGIAEDFPHLSAKVLRKAGELGTKLAIACLQVVGTQNHTLLSS